MDEKTFFEYDDVKVTNARFINGNQTYAMSNITSVKAFEEKPKRLVAILFLIFALVLIASEPVWGVILAAGIGYFLYQQKTIYHVMLATAGGEISALKTHQREYLTKIVSALNDAIVSRG